LFRADTLPQAISYLGRMFSFTPENPVHPIGLYLDTPLLVTLALGALFSFPIGAAFMVQLEQHYTQRTLAVFRLVILIALFMLSAMALAVDTYNPFIYFRF